MKVLHQTKLKSEAISPDDGISSQLLLKFISATADQKAAIDRVLDGTPIGQSSASNGPLLMGMTAGAKFLGVSRATLWRMVRAGKFQKIEVLPGSYRLRRADLESIVNPPKRSQIGGTEMSPPKY